MATYLLINRCDIINLILLGYLCFCVATESSDWDMRFPEISETRALDNCTQCDVKQESCICTESIDKCEICCHEISVVSCCTCVDCDMCWHEQQQLIMMTQIGISILFAFGVIGLIVVYCKICNRTRQQTRRCIVLHEARDLITQRSIIEDLRERPPSYNEVVQNRTPTIYTSSCNNAPPLYTSPYNRTSMQEAPPAYPGMPKPQEKIQHSNKLPSLPPIVQYM